MVNARPDANGTPVHTDPGEISWRKRAADILHDTDPRILFQALIFLLIGFSITGFAALYIKGVVETAAQREFEFTCNEIRINIAGRMAANTQVLYSTAAFFDGSDNVSRSDWRTFTEQLRFEKYLPGTQGIGFAMLIQPNQLDQHLQKIRAEGYPDYTVRPAGDRAIYSSIIFLEPFSVRNLRAFGYDMLSEPIRRSAMERARDENAAALSGMVILVQETDQHVQAGTLMYVPVYRKGMPLDTVEERRAAIFGWVYSPYRMADLMRGTLGSWEQKNKDRLIFLQVYDGDQISPETLLYDSRVEAGDDDLAINSEDVSHSTKVDFGGHRWTLRLTQMGGLLSFADYDSVWFILSGGIGISLLMFGLVLSLLRLQEWRASDLDRLYRCRLSSLLCCLH